MQRMAPQRGERLSNRTLSELKDSTALNGKASNRNEKHGIAGHSNEKQRGKVRF